MKKMTLEKRREKTKVILQPIFMVIFLLSSTTLYSQIVNVKPGLKEYYKQLGNLYLDKLEYENAINCYKNLLRISNNKGIRKDIGYAYIQLGKYEEAEKFLKEELLLFPQDYDSHLLLGCLYFRWGNKEKGAVLFRDYLTRDKALKKARISLKDLPNLGLAEYALGLYFKKEGDLERAFKYFSDSLSKGYEPIKNIIQRADIYILMNDLSSALKETELEIDEQRIQYEFIKGARESLVFQPIEINQSPEIYFMKGYILYKMGRIKESLENFMQAVRLEPGFKEARKNIAAIYYNLGNYEEAIKRFKSLKTRFSEDALINEYLAYAFLKKRKIHRS